MQAFRVPFYKNLITRCNVNRAICSGFPVFFTPGASIYALYQYQSAELRGFSIVRRFGKLIINFKFKKIYVVFSKIWIPF